MQRNHLKQSSATVFLSFCKFPEGARPTQYHTGLTVTIGVKAAHTRSSAQRTSGKTTLPLFYPRGVTLTLIPPPRHHTSCIDNGSTYAEIFNKQIRNINQWSVNRLCFFSGAYFTPFISSLPAFLKNIAPVLAVINLKEQQVAFCFQ